MGDEAGLEDLERAIEIAVAAGSIPRSHARPTIWPCRSGPSATSVADGGSWRKRSLRRSGSAWRASSGSPERPRLAALPRGRLGRGAPAIDEFVAACEAGAPHYHEGGMRLRRAVIRLARDDVQGALDDIRKTLPLARRAGDPSSVAPGSRVCAHPRRGRDRVEVARHARRGCSSGTMSRWAFADLAVVVDELECPRLAAVSPWRTQTRWTEAADALLCGDFGQGAELLDVIGDADSSRLRAFEPRSASSRQPATGSRRAAAALAGILAQRASDALHPGVRGALDGASEVSA